MRRFAIAPISGILLAALTSTIAASGVDGSYNCSSTSACFSASQTAPAGSSGAGFHGTAVNGPGMRGNSTMSVGLLGQSASGFLLEPGVEGESTYSGSSTVDDLGGGFGLNGLTGGHVPQLGVFGIGVTSGFSGENTSSSSAESAGVLGTDETGEAAGVVGESLATSASYKSDLGGVGVAGMLQKYDNKVNGIAVYGQGAGPAVDHDSGAAYGGYFTSNANTTTQSFGDNFGLGAESTEVAGEFYNNTSNVNVGVADSDTSELLEAYNNSQVEFTVNDSGDVAAVGTVTGSNISTSGDAMYRQNGASGSTLTAYGMRSASPEIEDVGEAQLVNGRAIVHIDAKLADVLDRRSAYHVFLTPEGDGNALYVAQKTPTSFIVAEQRGGRSTMAFDYRIIAQPYAHTAERLAIAAPL